MGQPFLGDRLWLIRVALAITFARNCSLSAAPLEIGNPGEQDEERSDRPQDGAAQVSVLKKVVGMMFWICGVPGSESIVKVNAPSPIVPGMSRLGMPPCRNISAANG